MLHLPLEVPRGLVWNTYKVKRRKNGQDVDEMMVVYAYPFDGTERLTVPVTKAERRPRERVSMELYRTIQPWLHFYRAYDNQHGKGAGMIDRPRYRLFIDRPRYRLFTEERACVHA